MIRAFINGKEACPSATNDIKIVLDNPYIKKSEEKTMDVAFPIDIPENRAVFGSINRLDTKFETAVLEDCCLVANNIEVIRGRGTITSVTEKEVRVQILAGKSSARYKALAERIFIDSLDYGALAVRHQKLENSVVQRGTARAVDLTPEYQAQGFIGVPGVYAFLPLYDSTNDISRNTPSSISDGDSFRGLSIMANGGAMPNLMHVMEVVMDKLGYTVSENYFNTVPWNTIYIVGRRMSFDMARALPHWLISTFLDEFRKLFNATYLFDDKAGTVRIVPFSHTESLDREAAEPTDEFSTSYEDEGVEYLGSSNLEYELPPGFPTVDCLSQDTMKAFSYREFNSDSEMLNAVNAMTTKQKLTTIMKSPTGYYYCRASLSDGGTLTVFTNKCGWCSPLVRLQGGSTVTLKMVPAAIKAVSSKAYYGFQSETTFHDTGTSGPAVWQTFLGNFQIGGMVETEFEQVNAGEDEEDNLALDYTTVADVIEDEADLPSDSEDDESMQLVFASGTTENVWLNKDGINGWDVEIAWPHVYTHENTSVGSPRGSFALNEIYGHNCVGQFHNRGYKIKREINGNSEVQIPFLFDGKPDPKKVYVFRNKPYICSKIEMKVSGSGIDKLKTGFFYEML